MTKESKERAYGKLMITLISCGFLANVPFKNWPPEFIYFLQAMVFLSLIGLLVVKLLNTDELEKNPGKWKPKIVFDEGERVINDGTEYEYRNGFYHRRIRRSWLERWYNMIPFVIILIDVTGLSWFSVKYWSTIRPYFDMIFGLNVVAVIFFTMIVMMGVETYIENKKKR